MKERDPDRQTDRQDKQQTEDNAQATRHTHFTFHLRHRSLRRAYTFCTTLAHSFQPSSAQCTTTTPPPCRRDKTRCDAEERRRKMKKDEERNGHVTELHQKDAGPRFRTKSYEQPDIVGKRPPNPLLLLLSHLKDGRKSEGAQRRGAQKEEETQFATHAISGRGDCE